MRGVLLLLTIFAAFAPPPASAAGTAQQREDCMADAFKFCASEIPFEFANRAVPADEYTPAQRRLPKAVHDIRLALRLVTSRSS